MGATDIQAPDSQNAGNPRERMYTSMYVSRPIHSVTRFNPRVDLCVLPNSRPKTFYWNGSPRVLKRALRPRFPDVALNQPPAAAKIWISDYWALNRPRALAATYRRIASRKITRFDKRE
jgi:hypothetical protein